MATKAKFDMGNLSLPNKPAVVKTEDSHEVTERAVETIHRQPVHQEEAKPVAVATKKISFDLPTDKYRFIKMYCLDQDITMREYFMNLIEADYKRKSRK